MLDIGFSSFYAFKRGETHVLSPEKTVRAGKVKSVFEAHRSRYGTRRLVAELKADHGIDIGRRQTRTLMVAQNLRAIQPKSFVPKTTDSKHAFGRRENLLLGRDKPTRPDEVYVGDITYIPMQSGKFIYLATWQDMFTRVIVGWELMESMKSDLAINALKKAIDRRRIPRGTIVHTDGGKQYASKAFGQSLVPNGFVQSMTRKDNVYDNAMGESLFGRFKTELMQNGAFKNFDDAYTEIFEYMEVYYNRKRRHSGIGHEIPERFEKKYWQRKDSLRMIKLREMLMKKK